MSKSVIVIGAGAGGLSAAIRLAAAGHKVTVLERQAGAGGKMLPVTMGGETYDTGPTVLTMRWVFEELFAEAGRRFGDELQLDKLDVHARHFWTGGQQLDLLSDAQGSKDAIGKFAGKSEAESYEAFARDSRRIHDVLRDTFLRKQKPTLMSLAASMPLTHLLQINPFESFWHALGRYFKDKRLRQLFGRYATYCGSSPFKSPATLMLVTDVEAQGVWRLPGGMADIAKAMESLARKLGVEFHFNCEVRSIEIQNGSIAAVIDVHGQRHSSSQVILNADSEAAAAGLFGAEIKKASPTLAQSQRSLSAITWLLKTPSHGLPLHHHNVFFSDDYVAEFSELEHGPAKDPTVYVCEQGDDRKLLLINAPARGARAPADADANMQRRLLRCGLQLDWPQGEILRRDPKIFSNLYPATGGALYGRSAHGWMSTFQRAQARTSIPGLYLAGGYTHPGPGVPMAILSGKLAADALSQDLASTRPFRRTAIAGGMSTR